MKPFVHAERSAKKYGGKPEDYLDIHQMMDSSKAHIADHRHRALFHHSYGAFLMEQFFGVTRTNSEGKVYCVRDIAEDHILEDLGHIPTLADFFKNMEIQPWMGKRMAKAEKRIIPKQSVEQETDNNEEDGEEIAEKSKPVQHNPPPIVIPISPLKKPPRHRHIDAPKFYD